MSEYRILEGDCADALRDLPEQSVQTCVTSPPYWGLRDYGTATWEGGDPDCDHRGPPKASVNSTLKNDGRPPERVGQNNAEREGFTPYRDTCGKCGAKRIDSQLGLEPTPEEYVANLVAVFGEVRRVLRDDGSLWLNLGDSYAAKFRQAGAEHAGALTNGSKGVLTDSRYKRDVPPGLKEKDLCGIPWRVAFALQADGWYLRSDIIWAKPNPMPESVTDRPTKAHEYLFLLTKGPRYFYDADAVREAVSPASDFGADRGAVEDMDDDWRPSAVGTRQKARLGNGSVGDPSGRNKRTVWTVATQPYPGAHFATFPPKLIEPCVLAGSAEGDQVLDPFSGAGTTGIVALRHNRNYIGIDLSADYFEQTHERMNGTQPMLLMEMA